MAPSVLQVVQTVFTLTATVLVIVTLAKDDSIFTVSLGPVDLGCGVFECTSGFKTKDNPGKIGKMMQAAQAFGILTVLAAGVALLCHVVMLLAQLGVGVARGVWFLHIAAALFSLLFWVLLVSAYTADLPQGQSAADVGTVNYGIFFGVAAFVLEVVVCVLYPRAGWGRGVQGNAESNPQV